MSTQDDIPGADYARIGFYVVFVLPALAVATVVAAPLILLGWLLHKTGFAPKVQS